MRRVADLLAAKAFMRRWNEENGFTNILDLQQVLCLLDDEAKMRELRRYLASLLRLKEDLAIKVKELYLDQALSSCFSSLSTIAAYKTLVVESALEMLAEKLVEDGLHHLMGEALSGMFDFDVEDLSEPGYDGDYRDDGEAADFSATGYDGEAADFMSKY